MLRYNANVQGFLGDGRFERSALQEAAEQGHTEVVSLLLDLKADVTHTFDEGAGCRVTAYDLAKRNNHHKVATMLLGQAM